MLRIRFSGQACALALAGALAASLATNALAASKWAKEHPRRAEVNGRLAHQDKRINRDLRQGKITPAQARQLHREDHQIRQEERDMASQNGGHITRQEQSVLNRQENGVSNQIPR